MVPPPKIPSPAPPRPVRLLLVEDSADEAELLVRELTRAGFDVTWSRVDTAPALRAAVKREPWDLVISDFSMPVFDGFAAFAIVREHAPEVPFIFVSGLLGEERAVEAMRNGARDYVLKGKLARLPAAVARELTEADAHRQARRAEEALRVEERRYRSIFQSAAVALAEIDFSHVREWLGSVSNRGVTRVSHYLGEHPQEAERVARMLRVLDANEAMARLLEARSRDELLGSFGAVLGPMAGPAWSAVLQAMMDRRPEIQLETEAQTGGGHRVPVLVSLRVPTAKDDFQNIIVSMLDISEQRRSSERTREAQRLETVGRLAGGVAHDFNNLLAVIGSFTAIVRDELVGQESAQQDLDVVLDATRRAAALTNQLLAFSRRQIQELRVVDVNRTIEDLTRILQRLIGEDIELVWQPGQGLGTVRADPSQIGQVLMNLVVNARDAMPDGGRITVETRNARPRPGHEGNHVLIAVTDSGLGMDEATRRRIFEPFFTTKEPGKGTGMGLSTVYGIVSQSGGHIEVQSAPQRGTRFEIYLPRVALPPDEVPLVRPSDRPGGSETVLLAEDDELVRKTARRILEAEGYRVLETADGVDALAAAQGFAGPIDLLLADMAMPRMNGRELAQVLLEARPSLKILFMSGHVRALADDPPTGELLLQPVLRKPFSPGTLLTRVREILDVPPADLR